MKPEHIEFLARKFNVVLLAQNQSIIEDRHYPGLLEYGLICNFVPNKTQRESLSRIYDKVNIRNTLFTYEQMEDMDLADKINAQISEYVLSYGLCRAFFRSSKKEAVKVRRLLGIDEAGLKELLKSQFERPIALNSEDLEVLASVIVTYIPVADLNVVRNNELRVHLLARLSGDDRLPDTVAREDLVRYIVFVYTGSTLLIKSKQVLWDIEQSEEKVPPDFLFEHRVKLSECFNRFKPVFLALKKSPRSNKAINLIARLSKQNHVPVGMPKSRTFVADFLRENSYPDKDFDKFTITDVFRILNAIVVRKSRHEHDVFLIRNGKLWFQERKTENAGWKISQLETYVTSRLHERLAHLHNENIKLPEHIKYGLPISGKQTIGRLPFGTVISTEPVGKTMSVGVYWQNDWGARDLDLSVIDLSGRRTGWGDVASYVPGDATFSGDITNAPEGAMEFMTLRKTQGFGLFVNIFSGQVGCDCKLVIGVKDQAKKNWIDNVYIEEKTSLDARGNIFGFVNPYNDFIVYKGQIGNASVSSDKYNAVLGYALMWRWTINDIFDLMGLTFDDNCEPTIDLSYESVSFEKLVSLFEPG